MSFADESADFVLCKESYHHFPRPPVVLYEMLRVARRAVVLIEPLDDPRLLDGLKRLVKRLVRGDTELQFAPSGNFLYRRDIQEMAKLMTAMGGLCLAFKGINDFYHPRFSASDSTRINFGTVATRLGIGLQNALSACRLLGYGLACVVLFRGEPETRCTAALQRSGFRIVHLPRNPYAGR